VPPRAPEDQDDHNIVFVMFLVVDIASKEFFMKWHKHSGRWTLLG
jgi:hypothetical protein